MASVLAFDLTRLFVGPVHVTPRGIDRVDFGFASHFLKDWPGDCVATLPTPWGVRVVSRKNALHVVDSVQDHWRETAGAGQMALFAKVKERLVNGASAAAAPTRAAPSPSLRIAGAVVKMLRHAGCGFGRPAAAALPKGALYLNTGQIGIAIPRFLSWLERRPDIRSVFMLHDAIPLEHSEFVPPASRHYHQNMLAGTARYASGIVVPSIAAGASVRRELGRYGRGDIPLLAEQLPIPHGFMQGSDIDGELADTQYFVVTGSIEPRKNHLLLLNVWRDLVARQGKTAPKLVVVGTRWRRHPAITDIIERSSILQDHVIEVSGLPTPALRRLLSSACALLMPSFAEGFGLPIIEALAVGTPVIASDLPAHREAGGPHATYLSAIDGLGWLSAIDSHVGRPTGLLAKAARYKARTWPEYLQRIEPFLTSVSQGSRDGAPAKVRAQSPLSPERNADQFA